MRWGSDMFFSQKLRYLFQRYHQNVTLDGVLLYHYLLILGVCLFFSHPASALNFIRAGNYSQTINAQYGLTPTVNQSINFSLPVSIPQQEGYPIRVKPIEGWVVSNKDNCSTKLSGLIKNSRGWLQPEKIVPNSAGFQNIGQAADFGYFDYQVGMEFKNSNGTIGSVWLDYLNRTCRLVGSGLIIQQYFQGENDAQFNFLSKAEITGYRVNATFQFSVKDANKLYTLTALGQEIGTNNSPQGGIVYLPIYN